MRLDRFKTAFRSAVVAAAMMAIGAISAARADAAPIFYDFTVTFNSGDLFGQSFNGSFSLDGNDCSAGVCDGSFLPEGAAFPEFTLLSVDFTIAGESFDMTDDKYFPNRPLVNVNQGNIENFEFVVDNLFALDFSTGVGIAVYKTGEEAFSEGTVGSFTQRTAGAPEPLSLTLLGLGVAGVAIRARRRRIS